MFFMYYNLYFLKFILFSTSTYYILNLLFFMYYVIYIKIYII